MIGCASTAAQKQGNYIRATLEDTSKKADACTSEIDSTEAGRKLAERVLVRQENQDNRFDLLRSKEKLSEELKPVLISFIKSAMKCRDIVKDGHSKSHPLFFTVTLQYYKAIDENYIKLLENEITIGEFNREAEAILSETQKKWTEASMKIDSNLAESHNREIEQEIKAYENRRSVYTYCNKVGNTVMCNSN
jgi:hypothetical protein